MTELLLDELMRKPTSQSCECRFSNRIIAKSTFKSRYLQRSYGIVRCLGPWNDFIRHWCASLSLCLPGEYRICNIIPAGRSQNRSNISGYADLRLEDRLQLLIHGGKRMENRSTRFEVLQHTLNPLIHSF